MGEDEERHCRNCDHLLTTCPICFQKDILWCGEIDAEPDPEPGAYNGAACHWSPKKDRIPKGTLMSVRLNPDGTEIEGSTQIVKGGKY